MKKMLVVGCGSIGLRHLKSLVLRSDLEIAAVDVNPKARDMVAEISRNISYFESFDQAAAWKPEMVILATPNHLHMDGCLWALSQNAHVLCEKPLSDTYANGEKMVKAAKEKNKVLAVGFTERFRNATQYIIEEAVSGRLGTVIGGRALVGTYNTLLCAKDPVYRCSALGSLLIDYVHELDILSCIFGAHKQLSCFGHHLGSKKMIANPSLAAMIIEFQTGAIVSVHFDYIQHPQRRIFEIYGDQKSLCYNFQNDTLEVYDCNKPQGVELITFGNNRDEQFAKEHEDFIAAARTGKAPKVSGEDALKSLKISEEAIQQMVKNGYVSL